ncbi:MAG: hypothetical protein NZ700_01520, partial [Gemmataceae bacterium]|nr:hypothetical protein [Gemmataceae bacterium]MDW8267182.1 hypothetical protein [Gemmataceae bacterium]
MLRRWIELGAPETAVSAAQNTARTLDLELVTTSTKPEGPPPMPGPLPAVNLPHTERPHPITALALSPWAPLLAVSGHERILLYHADSLKLLGLLRFPERIPFVLKFSRSGKILLAAGGRRAHSGKVVLFDMTSGKRL